MLNEVKKMFYKKLTNYFKFFLQKTININNRLFNSLQKT